MELAQDRVQWRALVLAMWNILENQQYARKGVQKSRTPGHRGNQILYGDA
jgi:hypothetical protein